MSPPYVWCTSLTRDHVLGIPPNLAVNFAISDSALLWVMCTPSGPYFSSARPLSLLATTEDAVRAWPGGTGEYKIAVNYGPTLQHHQAALSAGYDMNLWLFGDKITEAGVMNFFVVLKRHDGGT